MGNYSSPPIHIIQNNAEPLSGVLVSLVSWVEKVSETIKASKETKQSLVRIAARLQENMGKRVDFDEAIRHLISSSETKRKRPELLNEFFGSAPGLSVQDLYKERRFDELRAKRKYRI